MYQRNPKAAKGKFLLAGPVLPDPNFRRSVVLLTQYDIEGCMGFILNKPLELKIRDLITEIKNTAFDPPVFLGGPVQQDALHFIHRIKDLIPESEQVCKGVYMGGDFGKLFSLIEKNQVNPEDVRFFLGYSGWGPQQLEEELIKNSWIVAPSREKFTFYPEPIHLWKDVISALGEKYKKFTNYPEDPSDN